MEVPSSFLTPPENAMHQSLAHSARNSHDENDDSTTTTTTTTTNNNKQSYRTTARQADNNINAPGINSVR